MQRPQRCAQSSRPIASYTKPHESQLKTSTSRTTNQAYLRSVLLGSTKKDVAVNRSMNRSYSKNPDNEKSIGYRKISIYDPNHAAMVGHVNKEANMTSYSFVEASPSSKKMYRSLFICG